MKSFPENPAKWGEMQRDKDQIHSHNNAKFFFEDGFKKPKLQMQLI